MLRPPRPERRRQDVWTFAFPVLLTIALGIAFRSRPPEPVRTAVESGAGAEAVRAALASGRDVTAEVLAPDSARAALRTGRVSIVVVPGDPYRYDPTRPESRFARAVADDLLQPAVRALPLTALNDGLRAVMNEGAGLVALMPQAALLAAVAVASFGAALRLFRWS